ncbi:MAG: translation initiation factor IF-2 subunit gamma [Candidatus Hodarchaeales archaeon]|jgi:translation initiation factor 2 subunit 3
MVTKKSKPKQAEINIGMIGHVDHGKSTLVQAFSGKFPDTHSEELRRGISIRLGYADCEFRRFKTQNGDLNYTTESKYKGKRTELVRRVSFVDAPGHEVLMATMLSGAAIMDAVILVVSATEPVPMPQTREHLAAMNIVDMENLIVVQNKIELVTEEEAVNNFEDIAKFLEKERKGGAKNVPIIPISAIHHSNLDILIENIEMHFKTPERDKTLPARMLIARSFDINKPGSIPKDWRGGVLGGAVIQGIVEEESEIEIRPGINLNNKWDPLISNVTSMQSGFANIKKALPGGLIGVGTTIDPSLTKNDKLVGHVLGIPGTLPPVWKIINFEAFFLDRVVGSKTDQQVGRVNMGAKLMLNVGTAKTVGTVVKAHQKRNKGNFELDLAIPICADVGTRLAISALIDRRWRLVGWGNLTEGDALVE